MNRYPYDDELQKKPLNSEMIRYRIEKGERGGLLLHSVLAPVLTLGAGGIIVFLFSLLSGMEGNATGEAIATAAVILLSLTALILPVIETILLAQSIRSLRRVSRGDLRIEIDTVAYIEYARPRRVAYAGRYVRTVYEDFRHFGSGREFKDECSEHRGKDGDEFITAAFAADYKTIL